VGPFRQVVSDDSKALKQWTARCLDRLEHGKIEALVKILRESPPGTDELPKTIANSRIL
jgi:hypothetical protein